MWIVTFLEIARRHIRRYACPVQRGTEQRVSVFQWLCTQLFESAQTASHQVYELSRHFIESSSFTMLGARVRRPWRHNDQPVYQSDTLNAVVAGQEHVVVVSAPSWPSVVLVSGNSRPTRPSSSRAGTCDRFPRL